jgi:hypothetical protein
MRLTDGLDRILEAASFLLPPQSSGTLSLSSRSFALGPVGRKRKVMLRVTWISRAIHSAT